MASTEHPSEKGCCSGVRGNAGEAEGSVSWDRGRSAPDDDRNNSMLMALTHQRKTEEPRANRSGHRSSFIGRREVTGPGAQEQGKD